MVIFVSSSSWWSHSSKPEMYQHALSLFFYQFLLTFPFLSLNKRKEAQHTAITFDLFDTERVQTATLILKLLLWIKSFIWFSISISLATHFSLISFKPKLSFDMNLKVSCGLKVLNMRYDVPYFSIFVFFLSSIYLSSTQVRALESPNIVRICLPVFFFMSVNYLITCSLVFVPVFDFCPQLLVYYYIP